jgi:8-oxo-dGTP diphosphatase
MIDVTAAVIESGGRILICRRREGNRFGGLWEFPGGKTEPGESPEEGLGREIMEELDLDIEVGARIDSFPYGDPPDGIALTAFFARLKPETPELVLKEHAEARWVRPAELHRFEFAPADRPFVRILRKREGK